MILSPWMLLLKKNIHFKIEPMDILYLVTWHHSWVESHKYNIFSMFGTHWLNLDEVFLPKINSKYYFLYRLINLSYLNTNSIHITYIRSKVISKLHVICLEIDGYMELQPNNSKLGISSFRRFSAIYIYFINKKEYQS